MRIEKMPIETTDKPCVRFARASRPSVGFPRGFHIFLSTALLLLSAGLVWAASGGSLSGTLTDSSGSVLPGAKITLTNAAMKSEFKTTTDGKGYYSFPNLAVGHYDLKIEASGFGSQRKTDVTIDADASVKVDVTMQVMTSSEEVTVTAESSAVATQVETSATQLGEVVGSTQIQAIPLNGRSYTDLLSIQPGVSPITSLTPTSVIMAGATGTINPSGDLNPGNVSIDGQRESANGFMVNGVDVQEHMNGGTSVIPNLDSIEEFRVLTNNFDPEYGNYNGGMINVVTKSGSNAFHGGAFEFLRNTDLDAKNFFDAKRGTFQQNQFGGVVGGPIKKDKLFFFSDYQGTRTVQGITSPETTVLSLAERTGNFSDAASSLTGVVNGQYTASMLAQKLGYGVSVGEPYYVSGCTTPSVCVFPNAVIPQQAWSPVAQHLLQYIPTPNIGSNLFSSSAYAQRVRDDKAGTRLDANTRYGQISGYYFIDNYNLNNPYPGTVGGASIPGFSASTVGQAQEVSIGDAKILSPTTVNEFRAGFLRNVNFVGQPTGGLGVSLASQGFAPPSAGGITVQAPKYEGVENISFPTFVMGVPVTNLNQWNNTLYLSDSVSKVIGTHTLKFGAQFHNDQVNETPNATFNGTFNINGSATGSAFADFLLGLPSNYTQSSGQAYYLRNKYYAAFVEDSWRARSDLTINVGLRWDIIAPWSEKYNNIQTVVPGEQSVLYPNAIPGLVVPGDPGIPATLSPTQYHNFAPRVGIAYAPNFKDGIGKKIFGESGKTSIRASYGIFYTAFPGLSAGIMYGVPPFGYNYLSAAPPLLSAPFINASDGVQNTNPFPLAFPPHNVSASNPDTSFNFAAVTPISADPYWYYRNVVPYTENYMFSIQRQIRTNTLLTVSYVGNQGHHLLENVPTNVGNPALCLSVSKPSQVAPGSATCGPFGESGVYTTASGQTINGTRVGLGPNFGMVTAQQTIGNSDYNALEANLHFAAGKRATLQLAYTYSKSIDQASNIGEVLNPYNYSATRVISSWNMPQNFVATYTYNLPFDNYFGRNRLTQGWSISGTTRFSSGFPVTLSDHSDNSLLGTLGNGVNNELLDTPQYVGGPLNINNNPRNGQPEFNTSAFAEEALGQLGNAARRIFQGPGIENFDVQLSKSVKLGDSTSLDIRAEAFNVFNHAQFYGPASVDGQIDDPNFGHVVSAAAPRLIQLAMKIHF